jgi:hypothetical protein
VVEHESSAKSVLHIKARMKRLRKGSRRAVCTAKTHRIARFCIRARLPENAESFFASVSYQGTTSENAESFFASVSYHGTTSENAESFFASVSYQGTTSVVPQEPVNELGFSP